MLKFILLVFLIQCSSSKEFEVVKIEPVNFETCYLNAENLRIFQFKKNNSNIEDKKLFSCDFIFITEINYQNKKIFSEIDLYFSAQNNFFSKIFECNNLNEITKDSIKEDYLNHVVFCSRKEKFLEISFEYYTNNNNFTNPIFLVHIDLINQRKIILVNFDANPNFRRELNYFDTLLSYTSQNFSDRKPFFGGKFFLINKFHNEEFINKLSFPFILVDILEFTTKRKSIEAIYTDTILYKNCSANLKNLNETKTEKYISLICSL